MGYAMITRRSLLRATTLSLAAGAVSGCSTASRSPSGAARVVIVGGGFAGASCARTLKRLAPSLAVTLIEPKAAYVACPLSNLVLGGYRTLAQQTFSYAGLGAAGIEHIRQAVTDIDVVKRQVIVGGQKIEYDRLVIAPGISIDYAALDGFDRDAEQTMPHAWQAGAQTALLAKQLQSMPKGGLVVMSIPANPYRCPPGPYERASLMAAYLKQHNPSARIILLDGKDRFSKQSLFMSQWRRHYGDMIEWRGLSDGASVRQVDAQAMKLYTDFDEYQADVANVIPPQRAGEIAARAGVTDASGWCPIVAATFESTLADNVHVIGDAAIANAMPKSAFAANAQAKLCAAQIVQTLIGQPVIDAKLINTCYSMVTPDSAISVAGVYRSDSHRWLEVKGAGGVSPANATDAVRQQEAQYAIDWFSTLTGQVFGHSA